MQTALVTGAGGLLAPYLVAELEKQFRTITTSRSAGDVPCDLTDAAAVARVVGEVRPDVVIHAAALTDVDRCEHEPAAAQAANVTATRHLREAMNANARLVYISTDQVYPNTPGPHREGTEAPVNEYGRSKLAGERAAGSGETTLVLRTNLFGASRTASRASLSDFVARSLDAGRPITLFRDVWFTPLHMTTLAGFVAKMAMAGSHGIYNLGCRDGLTKFEFGLAVAAQLRLQPRGVRVGTSSELPDRAPRPLDLRLDVTKVEATLGETMPTCLEEITKL